jgi:hypothetical protein
MGPRRYHQQVNQNNSQKLSARVVIEDVDSSQMQEHPDYEVEFD